MRGKCLECENYYLVVKFRKNENTMELYGCQSPDVVGMSMPGGHPFNLADRGDDIEMLECYAFVAKKAKV